MADLPGQAQVVIIGGGVGGCSIAYHLTKMGWKDVIILERHELTSGSTWHSAGLVGQMRSDANLTRMMHYSTGLYGRLKAETEQDTSWREVGGIRLASSAARMEEIKRLVGMARSFGVEMELISPREAQERFPLMSLDSAHVTGRRGRRGAHSQRWDHRPDRSHQRAGNWGKEPRGAHIHEHQRRKDQPEERARS
jgi:sarcosine dehydrogenase